MTLSLLNELGVQTSFETNTITVFPFRQLTSKTFVVESDWSSASYFYSIVALSPVDTQIAISEYKSTSLQGDAILQKIYKDFAEIEYRLAGLFFVHQEGFPVKNKALFPP